MKILKIYQLWVLLYNDTERCSSCRIEILDEMTVLTPVTV